MPTNTTSGYGYDPYGISPYGSSTAQERSQIVPPIRSSRPASTLDGFFQAVGKAIDIQWEAEGLAAADKPDYIEYYPAERVIDPDQSIKLITFRVKHIEPSSTSNSTDRKPFDWQLRDEQDDPERKGYKILTYGMWEDVQVVFTMRSRSNERATQLAEWFHNTMLLYAYGLRYFSARGIDKLKFIERREDSVSNVGAREIYERELVYGFRLERLRHVSSRMIEKVRIALNGVSSTETFTVSDES